MSASNATASNDTNKPAHHAADVDADSAPPSAQNAMPPLRRDTSFIGMATTQFLGAFNDNLFKQLILLLATPKAAEIAVGAAADRQSTAMIVFSVPFLFFSGFAGYVADRISKRLVVVSAKMAEVVIMLLGFLGFWWYDIIGFNGMMVVLFLMGTHSAFFGPAKYGILPEILRPADLPKANGIFLMLTFMAIIFGTAAAGYLLTYSDGRVWIGSLICIIIAVLGTGTALFVRKTPPAKPTLEHRWSSWFVPKEILQLLGRDKQLLAAIVVVAIFWLIAGMVAQAVNALGLTQLGLDEKSTSLMTTSISVGIAIGCVLGGYFSRDRINPRVVAIGLWGLIATLFVLSLRGGPQQHLLGYYGSFPVLILLGLFTGMFVVPVQVTVQSRPPRDEKGRVIATMNQCTWLGIILGAAIYSGCIRVLDATGWPRNTIFAVTALLILPVAILYRPKDVRLTAASNPQ